MYINNQLIHITFKFWGLGMSCHYQIYRNYQTSAILFMETTQWIRWTDARTNLMKGTQLTPFYSVFCFIIIREFNLDLLFMRTFHLTNFHKNLVVPMWWPTELSSQEAGDPVECLSRPLASLSLRDKAGTSSTTHGWVFDMNYWQNS